MKRLFVSIELPESVRQLLAEMDPHLRGVRWLEPRQMYLTLSFLGNVSSETQETSWKNCE
jgi:2'-5' RNA ligase